MKVMFNKFIIITPLILFGLTLLSFLVLTSSLVSAGDVIDDVSIRVQVSCTMYSNMDDNDTPHSTSVNPGTYKTNIGITNFKVFCNDNEGFAVYAIGYTDNTDGKNVLTNSSIDSSFDIQTGTGTSGSTSRWAMRLEGDPNGTYPISIQNSFDSWHTVPNDYTLVAKRTANTDIGVNAEGAGFSSTYQVYASSDQPGGNYNGRVKYVMVHPHNTDEIPVREDQVAVIFDGDGLTFPGGAQTNKVVYSNRSCEESINVGTPTIVKTSNLASDGSRINNDFVVDEFNELLSFDGAEEILVMVDYGLTYDSGFNIAEGEWTGWDDGDPTYAVAWGDTVYGHGDYYIDGDTVTIYASVSGNDYGVYAKVYPIYENSQLNTEVVSFCEIDSTPVNGSYTTTTTWNDKWYMTIDNNLVTDYGNLLWFTSENQILDYIENHKKTESLLGGTVRVYAYNPYRVVYNDNNATGGTMNGFYTNYDTVLSEEKLAAPNYYRTGYGFAGWSEDPGASVNTGNKIYGPNEDVSVADLTLNSNTHETTLYAVWVPSAGTLQNWTGCSSLGQGRVTALTDTRDNNTYAVAKLADGNCWMIENLRLDAANSSDSSKAQGFGGVFTGLANSESANFTNSTTANSKYSTSTIIGSNQAYRFPRYNNDNTSSPVTNMTTTDANIYSYGNYYSWAAAIANTSDITTVNDSESVSTSICPTGWRLPYGRNTGNGNTSGGFYYLSYKANHDEVAPSAVDSDNFRSFPNNFLLSGKIRNNQLEGRGSYGYYWSLTANSASNSHGVVIYNTSSVNFSSSPRKVDGQSIRCLIFN